MNNSNNTTNKTVEAATGQPYNPAEASNSRWAVVDIHLLKLILKHSYMFQETQGPLLMADEWIATFATTCTEIDQLLGTDKRGFHWQQLGSQGSRVDWYWALGEDYAPSVVMYRDELAVDFRVVNSPMDPENSLRDSIREIVLRGEANARKQFKTTGMEGDAA